ncbi:MAG: UDP-N-acetylmuramoyl-tripeptide--D-alanyl-D-alanine ligase [Acidobacteria bacterium]|nr:UDP-N-acetylmuramoyl-tripeptide--D-alanyl-D-alanine ligase [Acidobacteriota bacterium]
MTCDLSQAAGVLGAAAEPLPVKGWSVDSRTLAPGDLFFALRGPRHDGHDYVAAAFARGAVAAVVERALDSAGPLLVVPDALAALHALAGWVRSRFAGRVVAVTGSAGKTTTKDAITHLLAVALPVGKSEGNLNNHVGVPLSLLRLPPQARAAVIEIGMNHAGEIRQLAGIARPSVGVVTNVGYAHAEFFGSIEGVARAKRELVEALPADGVAVLNADDARVAAFRQAHSGPAVTFGFSPAADVRAQRMELTAEGARFRVDDVEFETALAGRHGVLNLLAGLAVARLFGIPAETLREAVRCFTLPAMRGRRFGHRGVTILDDCYNSNPEAARAMLEALAATPARRRCAVLGEMLELGELSERLHRGLGREAAARGVDLLVTVRGAARWIGEEAVREGLPAGQVWFFDEPAAAGAWLGGRLGPGDAVLFKGSRGVRMERALERFME